MDKIILYLLLITLCWSCTHNSKTEKHQNDRDNIVNVRDKVKEIKIENVQVGPFSRLYLIDNYLIIQDYKSLDKLIHLFDKKTFKYLTSTASKGKGPFELTNMGNIGVDQIHHLFYVNDYGKQHIFSYNVDSVLNNPHYRPNVKMKINGKLFSNNYQYVNDTLCFGRMIKPIGNNDFQQFVAKLNMSTGEIQPMKYEHPEIEKKHFEFSTSIENGIYIQCYYYHDLMTICDLSGELKYNIYGPHWDKRTSNKTSYYCNAVFCNDKILVSYIGDKAFVKDEDGKIRSNMATKILVFDLDGDYIKTLDTGYLINHFCYDKENHKIIISLEDATMQFAYLDIDELIK